MAFELAQFPHGPRRELAIAEIPGQLFFTRAFGNVFILLALGLSLLLSGFSWSVYIDPAASLVIAASILISAIGVLSSSFYDLLDRTLEEADQIVILRELAQRFHDYEALHGIRSRRAGDRCSSRFFSNSTLIKPWAKFKRSRTPCVAVSKRRFQAAGSPSPLPRKHCIRFALISFQRVGNAIIDKTQRHITALRRVVHASPA